MLELILQDIERYNQNNSHLLLAGFRAAYTHPAFIGVLWYRVGHALWVQRRNPFCFVLLVLHRTLYPLIRIYSGLELSPRTQIGPGLYVAHFGPTVIHPETIAGGHLTIMQGVTIGARKDGVPHLGNYVSISAGAQVLGGIKLGDNVFVGAGAVVVKDVPSGCTVVGIPAKPVHAADALDALDGTRRE